MDLPHNFGSILLECRPNNFQDIANGYGEPGYSTTGPVVLGDYWCRCDKVDGLHDLATHYPRVFAAMDAEGWQTEWYDEWIVDWDGDGLAYRTSPDSYSWESSILWTDGDFLTPECGIDAWVEEVVNNPRRALPSHVWSDGEITALGFIEYECGYESGWHPGQTDDPEEITKAIRADKGDSVDILFKLQGVGQFDVRFCVFVRDQNEED